MSLICGPAKSSELFYFLYNRRLWPEDFEIFRSKRFESGGFSADVWVIKRGHVFRFMSGGKEYTEVAASGQNGIAPEDAVEKALMTGRAYSYAVSEPEFNYTISCRALHIPEESAFAEKYFEIGELKTKGLFKAFPETEGEMLPPFTAIAASSDGGRFGIEAVHAYPAERTLVYMRSAVAVSGGG